MAISFSAKVLGLLAGTPFGTNFYGRANPPPPAADGRTAALKILRLYISELTFYRPGKKDGMAIPFQIGEEAMYIDWPENEEHLFVFPRIAMISASPAQYAMIGLNSYVEEETRDRFAPGTVVQWQSEYTETIGLEIYASSKPELRAIISGLEVAMTPTEQWYGLRFKVPEYYDQLVCFALANRENPAEDMAADGRRRAKLMLEMRMNMVALVNCVELQKPQIEANVDSGCDGEDVEVEVTVPWNNIP